MGISNWIDQLGFIVQQSKANLPLTLSIVGIIWLIQILNWMCRYRLNILGIYPRNVFGLIGVPCSPFLHGHFEHLFFNTIPLFILVNLLLLQGQIVFIGVSLIIIVLSGLAVWLFGRRAIHIGASGVIMGYWGYLLVHAYYNPSVVAVILAVVCIYYLGGLWMNLLPSGPETSWEAHFFGFAAGVAAVYLYPIIFPYLIQAGVY